MIGVVMPSNGPIQAPTVVSLTELFHVYNYGTMMFFNPRSPLVNQARTMGVETALRCNCDHIMFIDSDMVFNPRHVQGLVARGQPIACATYPKRDGSGIVLGLGFCLIERRVFDRMPQPWFDVELGVHGEDEYFYEKASECGYVACIDKNISNEIGHLGQKLYVASLLNLTND